MIRNSLLFCGEPGNPGVASRESPCLRESPRMRRQESPRPGEPDRVGEYPHRASAWIPGRIGSGRPLRDLRNAPCKERNGRNDYA